MLRHCCPTIPANSSSAQIAKEVPQVFRAASEEGLSRLLRAGVTDPCHVCRRSSKSLRPASETDMSPFATAVQRGSYSAVSWFRRM